MARDLTSPAYRQIAAEFAEAIDEGRLQDGEQLPTRPQLEKQYGVSRQVVREALTLLHNDGYLRSSTSKGTFVYRPPRMTLPLDSYERGEELADSFVTVIEGQGHQATQRIAIELLTRETSPVIADQLALGADGTLLARRRTRFVDGIPYALADSYFDYAKVRSTAIASAADIPTGGRHILRDIGLEMVRHSDEFVSRRPYGRESDLLEIPGGCSVTAHNRISYTADGTPVRLLASILPSDRWRLTYEIG